MNRFEAVNVGPDGLKLLLRSPAKDSRGYFERMFCLQDLATFGIMLPVVQVNRSFTKHGGTVRGLHFQYSPHSESKLVSCIKGRVFDVAVDIRRGSRTFLEWHAEVLSEDNHKSLIIPEGFAHGFQALADDSEIIYFVSAPYQPESEGGLRATDPRLSIAWPMAVRELSARDAALPLVESGFEGVD